MENPEEEKNIVLDDDDYANQTYEDVQGNIKLMQFNNPMDDTHPAEIEVEIQGDKKESPKKMSAKAVRQKEKNSPEGKELTKKRKKEVTPEIIQSDLLVLEEPVWMTIVSAF